MLRQGCPHCGRFLAAASRRSRGRVSVPVWLAVLSDQLPIIALVSRYPTNQLIGRRPLLGRDCSLSSRPPVETRTYAELPAVSHGYPPPQGRLPTCYAPVRRAAPPKGSALDLHALGTPPALILSQDQTLHQWTPKGPVTLARLDACASGLSAESSDSVESHPSEPNVPAPSRLVLRVMATRFSG